jgi:hypothetical protein
VPTILTIIGIACIIIAFILGCLADNLRSKDEPVREMRALIKVGGDAYAAWLDSQPEGVMEYNEPFGTETSRMLHALSRMHNFQDDQELEPLHRYAFTYSGDDGSVLSIDGVQQKESIIFWARPTVLLSLEEALQYTAKE